MTDTSENNTGGNTRIRDTNFNNYGGTGCNNTIMNINIRNNTHSLSNHV